ncbi:MAG: DUF4180 domain-containing protein [Bacteroidia bacterium]
MKIEAHASGNTKIAEISSGQMVITSAEDGLDLLGNLYYQGFDRIIIYESNITPEFFDLKNGMAGEILQKFSTYRVRLAIVGDFKKYQGTKLNDFITESNRGRQVNFVASLSEGLMKLS